MKEFNTRETQVPVTIRTGYTHEEGNAFEIARQQIEKSAFYLQSIFHLLKRSSSLLEESPDIRVQEFGGDLIHLCEIGSGVSDTIFISLAAFYDAERVVREGFERTNDETAASEPPPPAANIDEERFTGDLDTDNLALAISGLLKNPKLPETLYRHLRDGVTTMFNHEIEQSEVLDYENSPAYIAQILRGAKLKREANR